MGEIYSKGVEASSSCAPAHVLLSASLGELS